MTVLENGDVCLEFLKYKDNIERVAEIFIVSADGQNITIKHPDRKTETKKTYKDLPEKQWKKYHYAYKFVELVKSKTPKITMYTEEAKFMLMENSHDSVFEASFYDGAKLIVTSSGLSGRDKNGGNITEHTSSSDIRTKYHVSKQWLLQCRHLETVISSIAHQKQDGDNMFPLVLGRRPGGDNVNITASTEVMSSLASDEADPSSLPFEPSVTSTHYETRTKSSAPTQSSSKVADVTRTTTSQISMTSTSSSNQSWGYDSNVSTNQVLKELFVPEVGWASQYGNGDIWVRFNDGSQLGVKSSVTSVTFIDINTNVYRYTKSDTLPEIVKMKLSAFPVVLQLLKASSARTSTAPLVLPNIQP
ncbi:serine/threonine-protein kinase PLK4-like [Patella vulgata]|uniref:serine/threonine-protein kinase PLK4-like n=1 Tax=Patella vulgata TaxID=6465 RepID=UPI0024A95BE1|nr:serine/threonine-protein kinase PLK4-like [Patella vulgata]